METHSKGQGRIRRHRGLLLILCAGSLLASFVGCATAAKRLESIETGATLYGMVYDSEKKPVPGCLIILDDTSTATTDVNGRFLLDFVEYGKHMISFGKPGFEDYTLALDFTLKSQIVYARLTSHAGLIESTKKAIELHSWADASAFLKRADAIGVEEPVSSFLWATIAFRQNDYRGAAQLLERLVSKDYREAPIFIFLADIYEFHLDDKGQAAENLTKALAIREDADTRTRLDKLTAAAKVP